MRLCDDFGRFPIWRQLTCQRAAGKLFGAPRAVLVYRLQAFFNVSMAISIRRL